MFVARGRSRTRAVNVRNCRDRDSCSSAGLRKDKGKRISDKGGATRKGERNDKGISLGFRKSGFGFGISDNAHKDSFQFAGFFPDSG